MNKLFATTALIFWFIFTLIFTASLIGMLLFITNDHNHNSHRSTWMEIGIELMKYVVKPYVDEE